MPVKIQNKTDRPVLLRFNSGATLHLGPRGVTAEVVETDVSSRIRKLEERHVVQLHPVKPSGTKKASRSRAGARKKKASPKKAP